MKTEEENTNTDDDPKKQIRQSNIILVLIVAMIVIIPIAYAISLPTDSSTSQNIDFISATDFTSVDVVTGEEITLGQFKGDKIVLNFVNYGCNQRTNQIVSEQLLAIKSLTEQRNDFIPVSVFCGCCPIDTLRNFATENELIWPWILDSDYSIINNYYDYVRDYGYPTLVFINEDQDIVEYSGFLDTSDLSAKLDRL